MSDQYEYFLDCVDKGGTVRTEQLGDDQYRAVCSIGGNTYYGRTRDKQTAQQKRRSGLRRRVKNENKRSST